MPPRARCPPGPEQVAAALKTGQPVEIVALVTAPLTHSLCPGPVNLDSGPLCRRLERSK